MDTHNGMAAYSRPNSGPGARRNWWTSLVLITSVVVIGLGYVVLARMQASHYVTATTVAEETLVQQPLEKIKKVLAKQKFSNTTALVDRVMELTNRHTVHLADAWHDRNSEDKDLVLSHLYRALMGDETARPHSSCGPRCLIMAWILQSFDIKSRQIAVISSKYSERITGHQQIEVLDPESGQWQLYDPTWDVHFADAWSGARVSAVDLYFRPVTPGQDGGEAVIEGVIPSNHDGSVTGWHGRYPYSDGQRTTLPNFAEHGAIMYYCYQGQCANEILVNRSRFDAAKTWDYPKWGLVHATFDDFRRKVYPNSSIYFLDNPPTGLLKERLEHPAKIPTY